MKFYELDARMRAFETADDPIIPEDLFIVARLDGRGFTKLTKETLPLKRPFDEIFRDWMLETARHLAGGCGFQAVYTYTQSDEISVLLHPEEALFGRRMRKLLSVLAGEASARFTEVSGHRAALDCRLSPLPNLDRVVDYFRWRSEDAARNALNAHCYWLIRAQGGSAARATSMLEGMPVTEKHELLFQQGGTPFQDLPTWQRRGAAIFWEDYEKEAVNPRTGETVTAHRRRARTELELPAREAYSDFVRQVVTTSLGLTPTTAATATATVLTLPDDAPSA